uniref:Uncharacterized protein n=1 Tax=Pristionchus pacificus TaxID=54126 RepID=A0A2A6BH19_PRIPA|eukprot:PDM65177.1 hypothetical protein PRIPAC_52119 [Pristionchus pacificus]
MEQSSGITFAPETQLEKRIRTNGHQRGKRRREALGEDLIVSEASVLRLDHRVKEAARREQGVDRAKLLKGSEIKDQKVKEPNKESHGYWFCKFPSPIAEAYLARRPRQMSESGNGV